MAYYAQIRGGKVAAITQTARPVVAADMVELPTFDLEKLGYSYAGGVFTAPQPAP